MMQLETNNKKCIVVIPVYKDALSHDEEMCVKRYSEVLKEEDIVFIAPSKLDTAWYKDKFSDIGFRFFEDKYFTGTKSYNHLLLNAAFYKTFSDYEYMLIAQTDACIWDNKNRLQEFINKGFDYYGAPWIPERRIWEWIWDDGIKCCKKEGQGLTMGNGGFCLRNIPKSIELINEFRWRKCYWFIKRNEDIFFGLFGKRNKCGFKLADIETGKMFSAEYSLRELIDSGEIPFGVHGWNKDFGSYEEMSECLIKAGIWE